MNLTRTLAAALLLATTAAVPVALGSEDPQNTQSQFQQLPQDASKKPPKFISGSDPKYTESARDARIEGTVILAVNINEKGKVTAVKVRNSLDKGLDRKAISAVKKWKFEPAMLDGKPVSTEVNISVDFRLYH
jgi:TonB family protein